MPRCTNRWTGSPSPPPPSPPPPENESHSCLPLRPARATARPSSAALKRAGGAPSSTSVSSVLRVVRVCGGEGVMFLGGKIRVSGNGSNGSRHAAAAAAAAAAKAAAETRRTLVVGRRHRLDDPAHEEVLQVLLLWYFLLRREERGVVREACVGGHQPRHGACAQSARRGHTITIAVARRPRQGGSSAAPPPHSAPGGHPQPLATRALRGVEVVESLMQKGPGQ